MWWDDDAAAAFLFMKLCNLTTVRCSDEAFRGKLVAMPTPTTVRLELRRSKRAPAGSELNNAARSLRLLQPGPTLTHAPHNNLTACGSTTGDAGIGFQRELDTSPDGKKRSNGDRREVMT
ncbi:hypothetical protein E2562_033528 [Oryza meyeriana var. granulata]|uniref:Uncharacterized protein n=1 Tax=Oryza meyeriana var. granulata TaxID=110450 RepID=A0A6G1CJ21_9ORYZ|nr:hypothetical protein E2562_033528 [Oryza meyeriana var. granulata]